MWVLTRKCIEAFLSKSAGLTTTAANLLAGCQIGLLKDAFAPTPDSKLTDITASPSKECNFDGYLRSSTFTFNPPFTGQAGKELMAAGAYQWRPTGSATINTCTGQFLVGSDSATLLGVEMFDAPVPLAGTDSSLVVVPIVGIDPLANFGSSIVSN